MKPVTIKIGREKDGTYYAYPQENLGFACATGTTLRVTLKKLYLSLHYMYTLLKNLPDTRLRPRGINNKNRLKELLEKKGKHSDGQKN